MHITSVNTILSLFNIFSRLIFNKELSSTELVYEFPRAQIEWSNALYRGRFPPSFNFGVATSAYQVEGAWNVNGKGESSLDYGYHMNPNLTVDGSNGDVAADSYHKYKEDVALAKNIGVKMFRISLSWSRLLPTGYINQINEDGLRYYHNLIDEMIANGIEPMVALFHWDLPKTLEDLGGWTNPLISEIFVAYAKFAFAQFGGKVKYWLSVTEPVLYCTLGYGGDTIPPVLNQSGIADYLCLHNILLAHSLTYHIYDKEFRATQKGKLGICHNYVTTVPNNPDSLEDLKAAERGHQWLNEWFLHPLFSENGDYPQIMKEFVAKKSYSANFSYSRLPAFTQQELQDIRGSVDYFGVNYFYDVRITSYIADDKEVSMTNDGDFKIISTSQDTVSGLEDMLKRLDEEYSIPNLFITGNGYGDSGKINDVHRVVYFHNTLSQLLKTMQKGIVVQGYMILSLIDGFQPSFGLTKKFGLFEVNFTDPNRQREPRVSAMFMNITYTTKALPDLHDFFKNPVVLETLAATIDINDTLAVIASYPLFIK